MGRKLGSKNTTKNEVKNETVPEILPTKIDEKMFQPETKIDDVKELEHGTIKVESQESPINTVESLQEPPVEFHREEKPMIESTTPEPPSEQPKQEFSIPEIKQEEKVSTFTLNIPEDKLLVDKRLFYEAMVAMVHGHTHGWIHASAMQRFSKMVGIEDYEKQKEFFTEVSKIVRA